VALVSGSSGAVGDAPDELLFASLMADNAAAFYSALASYLASRVGTGMRVVDDAPWQERERQFYAPPNSQQAQRR
jgi:hypothetical protein